jgi:hypothetical protein
MGWGGIKNIPPGFDALGGTKGPRNIVDEAARGQVPGLSPAREGLFVDLKRHLLHRDYARYFESSLTCASVLRDIEDGKYTPEVLRDVVEPALAVAIEQMESVQKDAARSRAAQRKMPYDAQSSLDQLDRKAQPLADAFPQAARAKELDQRYREISKSVRELLSP